MEKITEIFLKKNKKMDPDPFLEKKNCIMMNKNPFYSLEKYFKN